MYDILVSTAVSSNACPPSMCSSPASGLAVLCACIVWLRYVAFVRALHRPMSLPEVLQLPEICVEAGSRLDGDSCPVCLETFRTGDKVSL